MGTTRLDGATLVQVSRRWRLVVVPAVVAISVTLVFAVRAGEATVPTGALHVTRNPVYATQSSSATLARKAHIHEMMDENFDAGLETCSALGVRQLAHNLGVAAKPMTAARRFAKGWDPAFRQSAYQGCLAALLGHGG
jgi:hypothetical protein